MLWLGFPEWARLRHFGHDLSGPNPRGFDVRNGFARDALLFLAGAENRRTVAGSSIIALSVKRGRIMDLEKEFQELPIAQLLRVKNNLYGFSVSSVIPVRCIRHVAAGITDPGRDHTRVTAQQILHTPETTAGENRSFR